MRDAFRDAVVHLAKHDEKVLLLTGDLGYTVWEPFAVQFPGRFLNCGISEANMVTMAAGLAHEGFRPIVYSVAPFVTSRVHDQVRVDVCYHEKPVILAGVGSGYSYGYLGATHHTIEDIALMRSLPEMSISVPRDPDEVLPCLEWMYERSKPGYIRLGKNGESKVAPEVMPSSSIAVLHRVDNPDGTIISMGHVTQVAVQALVQLKKRGYALNLVHVSRIKPWPKEELLSVLRGGVGDLVTLEDHNIYGGLGSAVAEFMLEEGVFPKRFHRIGIKDRFAQTCGTTDYLRMQTGITTDKILEFLLGS